MATSNQTVNQIFQSKGLWQWYSSPVTNSFDGVSEKGEDFASTYGTKIGAASGGTVVRLIHNNNSIGDVVEVKAPDGSVLLYQHITASVKQGQILNVGDVVGTQNGLPIDQYSTGSHIEVRYIAPGKWSSSIDSWSEQWQNPSTYFASLGGSNAANSSPGASNSGSIGGLLQGVTSALGISSNSTSSSVLSGALSILGFQTIGPAPKPPISLAANPDVTQLLATLDLLMALQNPFVVNTQIDQFGIAPIVQAAFPDPLSWIEGFGTNLVDDFLAIVLRTIFVVAGIFVLYKVVSHFIDFGAIAQTGAQAIQLGAMLA